VGANECTICSCALARSLTAWHKHPARHCAYTCFEGVGIWRAVSYLQAAAETCVKHRRRPRLLPKGGEPRWTRARARPPRLVYLLCQCDAIFRQADAKSSAVFNANWHLPPEPEGDALRDDSERDQRGFTCLAENIRKTDRFPRAVLADEDISKAALLHLKEPERVLRIEFWQDLLVRNGEDRRQSASCQIVWYTYTRAYSRSRF